MFFPQFCQSCPGIPDMSGFYLLFWHCNIPIYCKPAHDFFINLHAHNNHMPIAVLGIQIGSSDLCHISEISEVFFKSLTGIICGISFLFSPNINKWKKSIFHLFHFYKHTIIISFYQLKYWYVLFSEYKDCSKSIPTEKQQLRNYVYKKPSIWLLCPHSNYHLYCRLTIWWYNGKPHHP